MSNSANSGSMSTNSGVLHFPSTFDELLSFGEVKNHPDVWYELWKRCWECNEIGIRSCPVERDEFPITLDPPLPSKCFVMTKFSEEEFWTKGAYIRQCYMELVDILLKLYGGGGHPTLPSAEDFNNPFIGFEAKEQKIVLLLGTAGSGKTLFLYFLLRCRLHARLPTILQLKQENFLLFTQSGVHEFPATPFDPIYAVRLGIILPEPWCLVDSNNFTNNPSGFLQQSNISVIQTTSPHKTRFHWTEKCDLRIEKLFMPPFTLAEAIIGKSMQKTPSNEHQLEEWFEKFTPSVRLAYRRAASIARYESLDLPELISRIGGVGSLRMLTEKAKSYTAGDLTGEIFVLFPSKDYMTYTVSIPTCYLASKLAEHCLLGIDEQRKHYFHIFLNNPSLGPPRGSIFEIMSHNILRPGGIWLLSTLSVRNSAQVNQLWATDQYSDINWLVIGLQQNMGPAITPTKPRSDTVSRPPSVAYYNSKHLTTAGTSDLVDNCFYIPESSNQPTFDSFYYVSNHAYIFQVTG